MSGCGEGGGRCLGNSLHFNLYNYTVLIAENEGSISVNRLFFFSYSFQQIASANWFISEPIGFFLACLWIIEKMGIFGLKEAKKKKLIEIEKLTSIVMAHSDIVADHMSHRSSQQMRFVYIYIHTYADCFRCAHCFRYGNASLTADKGFTTKLRKNKHKFDYSKLICIIKMQLIFFIHRKFD